MRPERLELEGFTAFRQRTEVDFRGAELFALSGPTGAGKSSLIDAITFALFGSVARYDDDRLVAPIISQGQAETRVALDFAIGEEHYRVVRVVRATAAGGATTKEARLERLADDGAETDAPGELLAGDAKQVTEAVERLLGLGFRQLTTCAVLPQGQFARFLHAKPAERQDLLVRLLDLGLYGRMHQAAGARRSESQVRAQLAERELERLAFATPEARAAAQGRIEQLDALKDRIERAQPDLDEYVRSVAAAEAEAKAVEQRHADLRGLAVPEGVEQVADRAAMAREELAQAGRDLAAAELVVDRAQEALAGQPGIADLKGALDRRLAHEELGTRITKGQVMVEEAAADRAKKEAARAAAAEILQAATRVRDRARLLDRAADLRSHLHEGDTCPVCEQRVTAVPPADQALLDEAEQAVKVAQEGLAATDSDYQAAERTHTRLEDKLADLVERRAEAEAGLDGRDATQLERALAAREAEDGELARAREAAREAQRTREAAERRRAQIEDQERSLREQWVHQHARVLQLGTTEPPDPTDDLAGDWKRLVAWLDHERPVLERKAVAATERAGQQRGLRDELLGQVLAACRDAGVEPGDRPPRDACVDALAEARPELARIDAAIADRALQEAERAREHEKAQVAEGLHTLLNARNFERWVLDEVLERLVEGATDVLHALSGGGYSLVRTDKGDFAVVDHTNADAVRSARTLSGGETFLASLALALALADRIADLSAVGARRLEAIFLDEGFGTLDPDTLDVVAGAIEELGAQGRTVGVVTHVRELAERLPVRFEVTKGPAGATVERVDA
jgi:exonuclease SbcC